LREYAFIFIKRCFYAAVFCSSIFTATALLVEELILGATIPNP
jgi:hypothetical protein